jgi:hypothetical protein
MSGVVDGLCDSLVSYFVVFYKNGFSPADLRRAQQYDGKAIHRLFHKFLIEG